MQFTNTGGMTYKIAVHMMGDLRSVNHHIMNHHFQVFKFKPHLQCMNAIAKYETPNMKRLQEQKKKLYLFSKLTSLFLPKRSGKKSLEVAKTY